MAPSVHLQLWEIFSASIQVILIDSCSVNSCNFGIPKGEMSSGSPTLLFWSLHSLLICIFLMANYVKYHFVCLCAILTSFLLRYLLRSLALFMIRLFFYYQLAMWETWFQSLDWKDSLEKGKATHSSILAWRIPRTLQLMESQRVRHNWATFTSRCLYILCLIVLSQVCLLQRLFPICGFSVILLMSFTGQTFLVLMQSNLPFSFFVK